MSRIDLRHGDCFDVLADMEWDETITDPPYGKRTHAGQRHGRKDAAYVGSGDRGRRPVLSSRGLSYRHWTPDDVERFVVFCAPRTRAWFCAFTSHDLIEAIYGLEKDTGGFYFSYSELKDVFPKSDATLKRRLASLVEDGTLFKDRRGNYGRMEPPEGGAI